MFVAVAMRVLLVLLLVHAAVDANCPLLELGHSLVFHASANPPTCFVVVVPDGISAHVAAEQPVDMALEARSNSTDIKVDGFEFGIETLTLPAPGQYRIAVRPIPPVVLGPLAHIMFGKAPPLHSTSDWMQAEAQATAAKRSSKIEDAEESTLLWQRIGDLSAIARAHLQEGDALLSTGDSLGARRTYEQALSECHSIRDLRCAAEAANNSGAASQRLGDFDSSLERLKEAASDWQQLGDPLHEGQTLSNIGFLSEQVGDFRNAIRWYKRSASLLARRDLFAYARTINNIGATYSSMAHYTQAQFWLKRAVAIESKSRGAATDEVHALLNLGRAIMLAGDLNSAESTLHQALMAAMRQPNRQARAMVLNNLGQLLWRKHMLDAAEAILNQALELHRAVHDKRGEASALYQLGLVGRDRGDLARARASLEQAIQIQTTAGLHRAAADSMAALAQVQYSMSDYKAAQSMAEKGAELLESVRQNVPGPELRAAFYDHERQFLEVLVDVAMRPGNPQAASDGLLAAERGRARSLLDTLSRGSLANMLPPGLTSEQERVQRQIDLLSLRLYSAHGAQESELRRQVEALLARRTDVIAQIRVSVAQTGIGKPIEAVEPWQHRCIRPDSAVIEYQLGERRSHLWFVTQDSLQVFELPSRAEIDRQVTRAVAALDLAERRKSPRKQADFEQSMRQLSMWLLGPLKNVSLPHRLILVLDGSLNRVPFAALRLPAEKSYLGLTHELIRSPSASYLEAGRAPRAPRDFRRSVLAIADPVFSLEDARVPVEARRRFVDTRTPDLARIPFMADIEAISQLVPESRRRILKGFDANPANLQALRLSDFGVLHFSTHALVDDNNPELSGIALSMVDRSGRPIDGFLHPHQLADWRLDGSAVVLSACDTGLGKLLMGEGLMGLSSSLFHAGAGQLVLSLAEVDGDASAQFFSYVYGRVFGRNPERMESALRFARQQMAQSDRWSDPYYWATFVAIGRPSQYR